MCLHHPVTSLCLFFCSHLLFSRVVVVSAGGGRRSKKMETDPTKFKRVRCACCEAAKVTISKLTHVLICFDSRREKQ